MTSVAITRPGRYPLPVLTSSPLGAILLWRPFDLAGLLRRLSTSCEAAVRTKPRARLCEGKKVVDESQPVPACIASPQDPNSESPRSGRQYKVFHPSRDARLGTPAWGVSPRIASGKAIKAREVGGSRIISSNVRRYGYHPLRGFNWHFGTWPGAHAPGFIMTSAPRTENRMMRQVCCCLCEPWVNVLINLFGAAERRPKYLEAKICLTNLIALPSPITLEIDAVAAPRLRKIIFDASSRAWPQFSC